MRNVLKLTLLAVLLIGCNAASAQLRFGFINRSELILAMPERAEAEKKMQAFSTELSTQLEAIQVEFNNKFQEYQKTMSTLSESIRQLKEKELQDLQNRFEEFQQKAQQDMQQMQQQLMTPVFDRASEAVKKVSKAAGLLVVYDISSGAFAFHNEAMMTDILPLVKKELGIKETAAAATPAKK